MRELKSSNCMDRKCDANLTKQINLLNSLILGVTKLLNLRKKIESEN
jgi:hypothetical protein